MTMIIIRKTIAKSVNMPPPNLIETSIRSYNLFLQADKAHDEREKIGLQNVFSTIFPMQLCGGSAVLDFVSYTIDKPVYSIDDCKKFRLTYNAVLKVLFRLILKDPANDIIKEVKEQEITFGSLPLITDDGTFIVNGIERVVLHQIHRAPGVYFKYKNEKSENNTLPEPTAKIIPYHGSYLNFAFNKKGLVCVQIDKKTAVSAITLFQAFGITKQEISDFFNDAIEDINLADESPDFVLNAKLQILQKMNPNVRYTPQMADKYFNHIFFTPSRYDLSKTGRLLLNKKLKLTVPLNATLLQKEDILATVKQLLKMSKEAGTTSHKNLKSASDDIDDLRNRRIRSVGEIIEHQFRSGLIGIEKNIRENAEYEHAGKLDSLMPEDLINPKSILPLIDGFLATSSLSHFADQTNPLSTIAQKRKITALGPGGIERDSAGFEIRDVHISHYGRLCPIESPEGQNVGLVISLSAYAKINEYGLIETPYKVVKNKRITDKIKYLISEDEEGHIIAQAGTPADESGNLIGDKILARKNGVFTIASPEEVTLMDVSTTQMIAVAAALIPFLGHDDAHRALMGSNMQKQAVPLLWTDSPLVGTGMEKAIANDSKNGVSASNDGIVEYIDAQKIILKKQDGGLDTYTLKKFKRSNQSTCFNQKVIVNVGQKVKAGDLIADGPAFDHGELALGKNLLVAFMPWHGYNFEDAILLSERISKEDVLTSVHIDEYEVVAKNTKIGKEEITKFVPDAGEAALIHLDETGIVKIGTWVKTGDVLVGKVSPKPEDEFIPEELLLKAIFGAKVIDVKDTSLYVPPGVEGVVTDVEVFSREKDTDDIKAEAKNALREDMKKEKEITKTNAYLTVQGIINKNKADVKLTDSAGNTISVEDVLNIPMTKWENITISGKDELVNKIQNAINKMSELVGLIDLFYKDRIRTIQKSDFLPDDVNKLVRVTIASKRKIQCGDKMAGRHGNKGIVSRILPEEDMPFLPDGTPVDVVLNPLGVPSRMNTGQILEVHLGLGAKGLGKLLEKHMETEFGIEGLRAKLKEIYDSQAISTLIDKMSDEAVAEACKRMKKGIKTAVPAFGGTAESDIKSMLRKAGIKEDGKTLLYDGLTGEPFDNEVTVGVMYMLKLGHMVDDKIHARSIGPYSAITKQPLKGRGKFGGQRLGEMEIWAIEAHGAAFTLQEICTIKSDDIKGRYKTFDAIAKQGYCNLDPDFPESFNVLQKELNSLCINVELKTKA